MATLEQVLQLAQAERDGAIKLVSMIEQLIAERRSLDPARDDPSTSLGTTVVVATGPLDPDVVSRPVAWGARVSRLFVERLWWAAVTLEIDPDWLMACIAWESGETFSPKVKNAAGSGATGLIQFMPATAKGMGTTTAALAALSAEDQIVWVYRYFRPWAGKVHNLADCYMCILLPKMVGKPDDAIMFSGGIAYRQNSGLDANRDGKVTKLEASSKVMQKLATGRKAENLGVGR